MRRKNLYQKCIGMGLAAVLALGTLAGCGNKAVETDASVEESTAATEESIETTESTAQAETVETAQTESAQTVESTAEVAEEVTYAEEQGWEFSDLSPLEMPVFVFWKDSDGNYTENGPEGQTLIQPIGKYTVGDITVSEPDEDGNVVYTIPYRVQFEAQIEDSEGNGTSQISSNLVNDFNLVDLYTGTIFPARDMSNDDSYDIYTDIVWDDVTYSVGYTKSAEWYSGGWYWQEGIWHNLKTLDTEFTVTVPADYDGLVLVIYNNGVTEYKEMDTENISEAYTFEVDEEAGESWDDYTFIRVSDYVTK